ncbi:MAG: BREX-2 system adenine-specific DNA-methyltransferase PglX, partial [bacterium]|nr:BREX-2 system adenine-specific DNA-methyltransferase PglX [bacterium]
MARARRKPRELAAQPDPAAALDSAALLAAAQPVLRKLKDDLLERADGSPGVTRALQARWQAERDGERTADDYAVWRRRLVDQIAAAWLLSCVFVRTLEDRGLLDRNRIAGPGARDSEGAFRQLSPFLGERDYLLTVFRELARLPGARELFDERHNLVWRLAPSAAAARELLALFRAPDEEAPAFRFGQTDTRFLGDLYQDLDEDARKRFALLQTPRFVESFILDRTLEPALETFGLEETTLIDPTCGSGHFLLGAFERLFDRRLLEKPATEPREAARRALDAVFGTDVNPFAVSISRFRLLLAYLGKAGYIKLVQAPEISIHVAVADSLLHNLTYGQGHFGDLPDVDIREWRGDEFSLEDERAVKTILTRRFAAVVGNPPYITVKDRILRERYRNIYRSAAGKYALAAPFIERFFQLGRDRGSVGMITANSFIKREFGKPLIEKVLPRWDLQLVVNTSGAYIPGHGTPTVLLFGRCQPPQDVEVQAVLAKRGEPTTPDAPEKGLVWSTIACHWAEIGFENDYVSIAAIERQALAMHPWSLGGGGANELKEQLELRAEHRLGEIVSSIGISCVTGEDDVFLLPPAAVIRRKVGTVKPLVTGEFVRDWAAQPAGDCVFPYDAQLNAQPEELATQELRYLWSFRANLGRRKRFGVPMLEKGSKWYELQELYSKKLSTPLTIIFAFVATHNHFALDRGGRIFNRTAPIIKLPGNATESDHLTLLTYLNSAVACFWMKQAFFDKGGGGIGGGLASSEWEKFYEFDGTKLSQLPLPEFTSVADALVNAACTAEKLSTQAAKLAAPRRFAELVERAEDVDQFVAAIEEDRQERSRCLDRLAFVQEEMDWTFYSLSGLCESSLAPSCDELATLVPPAVDRSTRPFAIRYLQSQAPRREIDRLFSFCGMTQKENVADGADPETAARWLRRLQAIETNENLRILEQPEFKRTMRDSWQPPEPEKFAKEWLQDRLENQITNAKTPMPARDLANAVSGRSFQIVCELLSNESNTSESVPLEALLAQAVPYLAAWRYTDTGLEKRAAWEHTWDLQRREDSGDDVGEIPVPPKYAQKDYRDARYWRLRGKLDVPKERFISYPGCESEEDGSPVYGWAGWDHLQRAQALATLYLARKNEEAWSAERLTPMLAGLLELLPWLKQWHNEPSEEHYGERLGDYFEGFLEGECAAL